ncbi:MAG: hypothetical protein GEU99_19720 [Luteitalea sp.]|nr:hypothetical protein [Luteitalea sp.]
MKHHQLFLVLICLLAVPRPLLAQVETARITGTIQDSSGAILPGVGITIIHVETSRQVTAVTNDEGRYLSIPLPVGEYRVQAELSGFKRASREGIRLEVAQSAVIDFVMEVGDLEEAIAVTADAPLGNTVDATQGQVIDNRRVVDLPLNGRDYAQLSLLSAGAIQPIGGRFGGFSAGGQRTTQNNYLLDGVDNNNVQIAAQGLQAEVVKPSVDALQEFKVVTNTYSAEYGRAAGGVVNVVLKSGSNDFHGTTFAFLRNEAFDAKNFFDPPDEDKPPFKRNQFGFSLGGPIVRGKTFFFGDYEGTRIRESRTVNNTIPTRNMREGDFSELGETLYDPATFDPATGTRQPFPNNIIPGDRIDPIARRAAAWYPDPQNSNATNNFLFNPPNNQDGDKWDIRADHVFSEADNVYFRFSYHRRFTAASPNLPEPAFGGNTQSFTHLGLNTALVWNRVFSPNLVTSTRVAWNRLNTTTQAPIGANVNAELGLSGLNQALEGGPQFQIDSFANLGFQMFTPNFADAQTRQVVNDTTWTRGNHTIKFGINILWLQSHLANPQQELGNFVFNGNFTRDPVTQAGGSAFADFLLGIPFRTDLSNSVFMNLRAPFYHFYVQNEWRASRKLTFNLGLRYEVNLPWVETRNGISNFDIDTDPDNPVFVVATDGSRLDRATMTTDKNNVAPRLGFAYSLLSNTVIRGGYGIFVGNYEGTGGGEFLETNPPFHIKSQISTDSINPSVLLREGVPTGILTPERAVELRFSSFERDPELPYSQQWNLNIQRTFAQHWLWEIGYYGAKASHLPQRVNRNFAPPGPGDINERRRYTSAIWPGTDIVVGPLAAFYRHEFNGSSNFHSLQTKVERRFSAGFSLLGSYIWSKTIGDSCGFAGSGNAAGCGIQDPNNLRAERSLDNQHMAHRLVVSSIWELPFGQGRRWGSSWGAVPNAVLGGWSVGGIFTATSGQPRSVTVQGNPANTGDLNRPNLIDDPLLPRGERSIDRWFNTDAFVRNDPFTFGDAGRNIILDPGMVNLDFAAYKQFQITEALRIQLRVEAFNATNTPHFDGPNTALGSPTFGTITSAGRPRNLQFGLKLIF